MHAHMHACTRFITARPTLKLVSHWDCFLCWSSSSEQQLHMVQVDSKEIYRVHHFPKEDKVLSHACMQRERKAEHRRADPPSSTETHTDAPMPRRIAGHLSSVWTHGEPSTLALCHFFVGVCVFDWLMPITLPSFSDDSMRVTVTQPTMKTID